MTVMLSNVVSSPAEVCRTKYLLAQGFVLAAAEVLDDSSIDWELKLALRNFAHLLKEKAAALTDLPASPAT